MRVDVAILGPLEVRVAGRPVVLGALKQRAVLAVLALHAGAAVATDRLVDEIWGESAANAARSVQVYVSALRTALGTAGTVLETVGRGYRLAVADEQVDARRFEYAATQARALLELGKPAQAADVAAAALALWRGPVLADLPDLLAAQAERDRLSALRVDTLEVRFDAELGLGRAAAVVGELDALVTAHPLRERLRGQLMLALHRCGRQSEALEAYRAGRAHLVDELGVEPGGALQELHAAILRDDPLLRVEPAELRARRHLPAPATRLIGRRREIDEVTAMLRGSDVRLLTATGPGGIGKTRLTVQAAFELADAFPDGVWFVGLAELRDPDLLLSTVAAALGVDEAPDEPWMRTLRRHLAVRQLLLVLDNFEQIDSAAPVVAELVSAAPRMRVLVTSRSPLRLYGEHEYPVPQLALADEAVPLFGVRARAADPAFRVDAGLEGVVGEVCSRLDCLPLAIELAAARVRDIPADKMLATLPGRLDLADSGPRDLAARQQTLRNAIGWSHDLLSPQDRRVFATLGVFVGGCTDEAARRVTGADTEQLARLVAARLVQHDTEPATDQAYSMLETIREYADEQLGARRRSARSLHAAYFLELAESSVEGVRGAEQATWAALDSERDNFRAALDHLLEPATCTASDNAELGLRLAAALGFYWYRTGVVAEGTSWLERALAAAPAAPDRLRGKALHLLGVLVGERGDDNPRALELCETSCALFRRVDDVAWIARSLNSQGGILRDMGEPEHAQRRFAESAELRRKLGDEESLAIVLGNLALVALDLGDLSRAREAGEECLDRIRGRDPWLHGATLQVLADVAVAEGAVDRAVELLDQALPLLRPLGAYRLVEYVDSCAGLAAAVDRPEDAARLTGAADAEVARLGSQVTAADASLRARRVAPARRVLGDERFAALLAAGGDLTLDQALAHASSIVSAAQAPRPG